MTQPPSTLALRSTWRASPVLAPTGVTGANGICFGPGGRLYVAGLFSNRVTSVDPSDPAGSSTIAHMGGSIVGPDDVAFAPDGSMIVTQPQTGSVDRRDLDGSTRTLCDELPFANGIAVAGGRLFVNECRDGGRLVELPLEGGAPRVIADGLPFPNAMEMGPDGLLYVPVIGAQAIWRIDVDGGGAPEVVVDGVGYATSARFDADGTIVVTDAHAGLLRRVDPRSRRVEVIATLPPGLDNCALRDGVIHVSNHIESNITEVRPDGTILQARAGLQGPFGIATLPGGAVLASDGLSLVRIVDGVAHRVARWRTPVFPGFVRGVQTAPEADTLLVTTSGGDVARLDLPAGTHEVLLSGGAELAGLDVDAAGTVIVADAGAGQVVGVRPDGSSTVLVDGLGRPTDVCAADGLGVLCVDAETASVVDVGSGETVAAVGGRPVAIASLADRLFVLDAERRAVLEVSRRGDVGEIASGLAVGPPPGVSVGVLPGTSLVPGPLPRMSSLASDGHSLVVGCDLDGSVVRLEPAAVNEGDVQP